MEEIQRLKGKVGDDWGEVYETSAPKYVGVREEKDGILVGPLRLEMGFLGTFLEYAAPRCIEYQNLKPLLMRAHDLYIQALMFLIELPIASSCASLYVRDERLKMLIEWAQPAAYTLHEVKLVNLEIIQVYRILSGRFHNPMSYDQLMKFVNSLLLNIEVLLDRREVYLVDNLRIKLKALQGKLGVLATFLMFVTRRCLEHEKLTDLFAHATFVAYGTAYLCHSCFLGKILDEDYMPDKLDADLPHRLDEDMQDRLTSDLSELVGKIDPAVSPQAGQIYIPVLQASSKYLPSRDLNTSMRDTVAVDLVESLMKNVRELFAAGWTVPIRDQIQILLAELTFLSSFLKDPPPLRYVHPETLSSLFSQSKIISCKAGSVVYALSDNEMNEETAEKAYSSLFNLAEELQPIMAKITTHFVKLIPTLRCPKFPSTDELRSLDRFLWNLGELLKNKTSSISCLILPFEPLLEELQFLRSSLSKIAERQLKVLWRRIMEVACKAEYIVDSILAGNGPIWRLMLWLPEVRKEVESLKAEVDKIGDEKVDAGEVYHGEKISGQASLQTNFQDITEVVVGFEDVEKKITEDLVGGLRKLQMIAIFGMPGQGKTHLAKKIYNNPIVKDHFDVCAWCYVSPEYDRKSLLARILSQVPQPTEEKNERADEEELAEELYKSLKGRRYFILMDDLWDAKAWDALRRSFPDDNSHSRIMYTSRYKLKLGAFTHHRPLRPFSDDESWQLLQRRVFQSQSCPLELLHVGKQIAKDCNGLPLAVVLVAGILARTDKKQHEWSKIANSLSSYILHDKENNWKEVIELSYKHLPDYLKPCFLYTGAFVEDGYIEVQELIRLWVAERFVHKVDVKKSLEEIAEDYLVDLINRSLIIIARRRSTGDISECRIHDLVRDFSLLKAQEENFLWFKPLSSDSICRQRHRRICFNHPREILYTNSYGPHVRSLLFLRNWDHFEIGKNDVSFMCGEFKLLTVLKLGRLKIVDGGFPEHGEFPEEINSLVHLRFLSISGGFQIIPASIANLWNLETLIVHGLGNLDVRLPHTVWNMIKLRHLDVYQTIILDLPCDGVRRLENLQTIANLKLSAKDDTVKLMEGLGNVKHLSCSIDIRWHRPKNPNWLRGLATLSQLQSLNLQLGYGEWLDTYELSFPLNLKELRISGRFNMPWNKIYMVIGKLQNLEVLELRDGAFEGEEWNMTDDGDQFRKLKFLELWNLNIRKWSVLGDFPPLEQLVLTFCWKLEEIPYCLRDIPTLKVIKVTYCNSRLKNVVKRIEEEQLDMGNEELKVTVERPLDKDLETLKMEIEAFWTSL